MKIKVTFKRYETLTNCFCCSSCIFHVTVFVRQVCEMDVSKQLQAYEVEYHVLQDELLDTPPTLNQQQRAAQLERTNQSLRQQNLDLLEELQVHKLTKIWEMLLQLHYVKLLSLIMNIQTLLL